MSKPDVPANASRRRALGALGVAAAAPALAAAADEPPARRKPTMQDPRTAMPKPPFPAQQQPWPGLTSKMNPRPDHGENSYVGSGRLAGRKVLLTGGDSGLGRAAAIAFAREGADVAINYLPAEESDAKEVVALIREAGRKAVALPGDLREEKFCRKLVRDAVAALGGLDVLVNNAARQTAQPSIREITTRQFDDTLKTNLYAMFWITQEALKHLPAGASIINTASTVAGDPPEQLLDYSTTKAGIVNFTKGLAKQLAKDGIRVNAIAPGPYWTPLQPSGGQLPKDLPTFGADTPLGRPGQPAEIAPLFVLLASQESSYTTGNVLSSTGGRGDV
jgi:NAD(P)-dependent dehydrogenase (short-subunit alcohol dehydrogenase family)